jgi:hypothetical protein
MAPKLGELLIKHQMITHKQLDEALQAQHIFGGRLGTNLVELGYLSEQVLVQFLSAQFKLPAVTVAEIDSIKEEVIKLLPRALAEKYKVLPVSVKDRRMRLAMADATHLKAIDEVAFSTGCAIQPLVAPELLITYALEKYYGIQRPTRYVRLTGTSSAEFQVVQTAQSVEATQAPVPSEAGRTSAQVSIEHRGSFLQRNREDFQPPSYGLSNAAKELAAIQSSTDAFQILKKFAAQDFRRAMIFVLRAEMAIGWHHVGCAIGEADFRKVSFPIANSRLLSEVARSSSASIVELPSSKVDNWLASLLALANREVFVVPIKVNDAAVGIFLASEPLRGTYDNYSSSYNTLATKMSHAIQMAYLRKRILDD